MMDGTLAAVPAWISLHPAGNVVVARVLIEPEAAADIAGIRALQPIPHGHKMSIADIAAGEPVRKYGQIIGFATQDIRAGDHVHLHNLAVGLEGRGLRRSSPSQRGRHPPRSCPRDRRAGRASRRHGRRRRELGDPLPGRRCTRLVVRRCELVSSSMVKDISWARREMVLGIDRAALITTPDWHRSVTGLGSEVAIDRDMRQETQGTARDAWVGIAAQPPSTMTVWFTCFGRVEGAVSGFRPCICSSPMDTMAR